MNLEASPVRSLEDSLTARCNICERAAAGIARSVAETELVTLAERRKCSMGNSRLDRGCVGRRHDIVDDDVSEDSPRIEEPNADGGADGNHNR
jgi:hypothetical protein